MKKKNIRLFDMLIKTNDGNKFERLKEELKERGIVYTMSSDTYLLNYCLSCVLSLNDIIKLMEIGLINDDEPLKVLGYIS